MPWACQFLPSCTLRVGQGVAEQDFTSPDVRGALSAGLGWLAPIHEFHHPVLPHPVLCAVCSHVFCDQCASSLLDAAVSKGPAGGRQLLRVQLPLASPWDVL